MKRAMKVLQTWFFTGLLVWLPFVGTVYLFYRAFIFFDSWAQPLALRFLGRQVPGLGLAVLVIAALAVGALVSNFIGKRLITIIESVVLRIPAFNVVYKLFRDLSGTFLSREKSGFREVVAVRFPSQSSWAVGFVTGPVPPALAAVDEEEKVLVFIMQAFSPATGFLIALPKRDTIKLDMPVDEAIKMILTGGLVKQSAVVPAEEPALAH